MFATQASMLTYALLISDAKGLGIVRIAGGMNVPVQVTQNTCDFYFMRIVNGKSFA